MEASFETLVVMTPAGEFINVPWKKHEIPALGSEIEFNPYRAKHNLFSYKKLGVLVASIVLFFLAIPFVSEYFFSSEQQVIAYVGIDINPSIELGVDKEGIVKEARGLNDDGKGLIKDLQFVNLSLDNAIKLITQEAVAKQYITSEKENNIIITYCTRKEREMKKSRENSEDKFVVNSTVNSEDESVVKTGVQIGEESQEQIKEEIKDDEAEEETEILVRLQNRLAAEIKNELKKQNIEALVEILEIQPEFYDKAKKAELSPGKYAVMLQAMNEGIDVSLEDVKFSSVVHAIKAAGGNPGEIISRAKKAEGHLIEIEKEIQKSFKKPVDKKKLEKHQQKNFANELEELLDKVEVENKNKVENNYRNNFLNTNKPKVKDDAKEKDKDMKKRDTESGKRINKDRAENSHNEANDNKKNKSNQGISGNNEVNEKKKR